MVLNRSLGYGVYTWQLAAPPTGFDSNVVLGLFTYESDSREVDIEFSRWGGAFPNATADFAVQPRAVRRFEAGAGAPFAASVRRGIVAVYGARHAAAGGRARAHESVAGAGAGASDGGGRRGGGDGNHLHAAVKQA